MIIPKSVMVAVNGVRLHTVIAGPEHATTLLFLHGFPDALFGWRHQFGAMLDAGYRVVAPDLRGANLSSKPTRYTDYQMADMVGDIVGLADALGLEKFVLVGHDFGGALAWHVASLYPNRVQHLVVLNAPHPEAFTHALETDPMQQLRSVYIGAMVVPWIAQWYIEALRFTPLMQNMPHLSKRMRAMYETSWRQPDALFGMTSWYRANLLHAPTPVGQICTPTTILWGEHDKFLARDLPYDSAQFCDAADVHVIADAGHWVQVEAAAFVNETLCAVLRV